jgi:hypothetical protein
MARKLKTFVTSLGFFDLAVAAPSMKAALDTWGFRHNAFQQGFASETGDAQIIRAAMAHPGIVLRRPVGTDQPFGEDAELPQGFSLPKMGKAEKPGPAVRSKPKKAKRAAAPQGTGRTDQASIISFKAEKARRDRQRAQAEAAARHTQERRRQAVSKAQSALEKAQAQHDKRLQSLERERVKLEGRFQREQDAWDEHRGKLEAQLDRARKN